MLLKMKGLSVLVISLFMAEANAAAYVEHFCRAEFEKLCKDSPGAFQCLKKYPKMRSPLCDSAFKAYEKEFQGFLGPCSTDPQALACTKLEPGKGLVQPCLVGVISKVSPACAKHIKAPPREKFPDLPFESQYRCAREIKQYCSKVTYGEGRLGRCLRAQAANITGLCKEEVDILLKSPP